MRKNSPLICRQINNAMLPRPLFSIVDDQVIMGLELINQQPQALSWEISRGASACAAVERRMRPK